MECCIGIFALCCVLTAASGFSKGIARSHSGSRTRAQDQQNSEAVHDIALLEELHS